MSYAAHLPHQRDLLVPILAFVIGAAGATATYAAVNADSVIDGGGSAALAGAKHAPMPPRAETGATGVPQTSAYTGHKGGGPPAEPSSAPSPTGALPTNAHRPVSPLR